MTTKAKRSDVAFPVLVSYAYLRKKSRAEGVQWILNEAKAEGYEIMLDSGAFSAKNSGDEIGLDDYLAFLDRWKDSFCGYVALDVLGDPVATEQNLKEMLRQGFDPMPVHVWGDDERRMDELFEMVGQDKIVCLGGLRRPGRGAAPKSYVKQKMAWAKGRKVHWLGYTDVGMIQGFKPYSVDCSNWNEGQQWGRLSMYFGAGRWTRIHRCQGLENKNNHALTPEEEKLIEDSGFTPSHFYDDKNWRRRKSEGIFATKFFLMMVNAMSWVRYTYDMRDRCGTRLFLATALLNDDLLCIREGVKRTKEQEW